MSDKFYSKKVFWQFGFLTLIFHFLLLLNDSSSWDSLLLTNAFEFKDATALRDCIFNTGRRTEYFIALFLFQIPHWVLFIKITSFLLLWYISYVVYLLLRHLWTNISTLEALLLTTLMVNAPFYVLWFEPIMYSYTICEAVFFTACLWYFHISRKGPSIAYYLQLIGIAVLFFWSFEIQSFFVFAYTFLFLLFLKDWNKAGGFWYNVWNFVTSHWAIIAVPVVSFVLWQHWFPITGMVKEYGYNQISLSPKDLAYHFGFSLYKMGVALPKMLMEMAIYNPISTVLFVASSAFGFYIVFAKLNTSPSERPWSWKIFALIAGVLIVTALLPYNMVGKDYGALNRNCRNGLLVGFGIAFLLTYIILFAVKNNKLRYSLLGLLFILFAYGTQMNYLFWQAHYIRFQKQAALFKENTSRFPSDYLVVTEEGKNPMFQYYTYYEFNYMLKKACNGQERFLAFDHYTKWEDNPKEFMKRTPHYRAISMFSDFNNDFTNPVHVHFVPQDDKVLLRFEKIVWNYWSKNKDANVYPMQLQIAD
jgi:hypothetical protein